MSNIIKFTNNKITPSDVIEKIYENKENIKDIVALVIDEDGSYQVIYNEMTIAHLCHAKVLIDEYITSTVFSQED